MWKIAAKNEKKLITEKKFNWKIDVKNFSQSGRLVWNLGFGNWKKKIIIIDQEILSRKMVVKKN